MVSDRMYLNDRERVEFAPDTTDPVTFERTDGVVEELDTSEVGRNVSWLTTAKEFVQEYN